MKGKNNWMYHILHILAWVIFAGLCIEAGGLVVNVIMREFVSVTTVRKLWMLIDLSNIYASDKNIYFQILSAIILVAVLKAVLFYKIVKLFSTRNLDLVQPFNIIVAKFLKNLAVFSIVIGLICIVAAKFTESAIAGGVALPSNEVLRFVGGDVWVFMGIILLVVEIMFKRGIDIQEENDLTI